MSRRTGTVVRGSLPKYENFFDVGGPVWASTRLLDFADLDGALARVGEEWGFTVPAAGLARRNVGPRPTRSTVMPPAISPSVSACSIAGEEKRPS